jgi:transposase
MAMGKRDTEEQQELFITHDRLPRAPGHVFYRKLNQLLAKAGFDRWVEALCEPYYCRGRGRPLIPPGVYFRMLLVGYFEGIGSQRDIAWRCSDSLSLREFLGIPLKEDSPDHSSLSYIRNRLPHSVHEAVFVWVLELAHKKNLLAGKTVGVDSTTLEASAAMKSIVRQETGEDWKQYLTRLMQEAGLIDDDDDDPPSDEDLRKFDKSRKNKKVSNDEWTSPSDSDSRIARMKDGTTHLAYKAEHVVDLEAGVIVAAEIYHANEHDTATLEDSLHQAQTNQREAGSEQTIQDAVADKGYHAAETLSNVREHTRRIARTFPNRSVRSRACGPTSRRSINRPWWPIVAARGANADASCSAGAASGSNEASPTCARRAAPDERGWPASKRCGNATCSRPRRTTWACSCARCSAWARRGACSSSRRTWRGLLRLFILPGLPPRGSSSFYPCSQRRDAPCAPRSSQKHNPRSLHKIRPNSTGC